MSVSPTGMLSLPLHYLRLTVAGSSNFQTWVGAANATEALARVYPILTDTLTLPLAAVDFADNFRRSLFASDVRNWFKQEGDLAVLFRASIDSEHNEADAAYTFLNSVGAIISDMEALAGKPGYLDISGITVDAGPQRPLEDEKKTIGDFYEIIFRIEWQGI